MIISASYKTDIPTFYGEWFIRRLRAGYCKMVNPIGRQIHRIDLLPESVDGFVFWTKNVGPFLKYLPEIHQTGIPFVIQHSINGYPHEIEARVTNSISTVEHMKSIADEYGSERLIWRYDPIVFTSLTTYDDHLQTFVTLAQLLEGTTDEVVVSFAQLYKKTVSQMEAAAKEHDFSWQNHQIWDTVVENGRKLLGELAGIAQQHHMQLKVCSQKEFLIEGIQEARCIDAERLARITGNSLRHKAKLKGNRAECGCFESRDIGEYNTCPHGCVYCYAVRDRGLALNRYKAHDPFSEFLFQPKDSIPEELEQTPSLITLQKRDKRTAKKDEAGKRERSSDVPRSLPLWSDET